MSFNKITRTEKIQISFSYFLQATIAIAIIISVYERDWFGITASAGALLLTFIPKIVERNFKIVFPTEFELTIVIFIYLGQFLGSARGYYNRYAWLDEFVHFVGGTLVALLGFLLVYIIYYRKGLLTSPRFIAITTFFFSLAIGSLWEIFEFLIDTFFGSNMQLGSLLDTMLDLTFDCIGAVITSVCVYFYIKSGEPHAIERLIRKFLSKNPRLSEEPEKNYG
jgi:hypothetical protein